MCFFRVEKCNIDVNSQSIQAPEWYFFSHKDKKYPTGTRTNRATVAGFWKATGRDKAVHSAPDVRLNVSRMIGMRKTLVFYRGRAPHGKKTDWIMHEYRLEDDKDHNAIESKSCNVGHLFNNFNIFRTCIHNDSQHLQFFS